MTRLLDIQPDLSKNCSTPEPSLREIVFSYYEQRSPEGKRVAEQYLAELVRLQRPLNYRSK